MRGIYRAAALLLVVANLGFSTQKLIIAHRGASAYLPEHTFTSKAYAYATGAQYLEQDVVMTKDDRLIVLHDHYLDRVSDVADRFPKRARDDGRYYAIDFTLDEIRTLKFTEGFDIQDGKKVQGYPNRFPMMTGSFEIHTLEEEIELIQGMNKSTGKDIGIYVETKAPWLHQKEGKDIMAATMKVLKDYGYTSRDDKVYLQSFDVNSLLYVKNELQPKMKMNLKLVQLIAYNDWNETEELVDGKWRPYDYDWMLQPGAMAKIAEYADGVGPSYSMLFEKDSSIGNIKLTIMSKEAKDAGLPMHPFTVRADKLPAYVNDVDELFDAILVKAGSEGVFTDFPDLGVQFLQKHHLNK